MKANKYLSIAFAAAALATIGSAPTFAQSLSHDGSLMPHYFDKDGELKWGGWAPPAAEQKVAQQKVTQQKVASAPRHNLYLYAGRHSLKTRVR